MQTLNDFNRFATRLLIFTAASGAVATLSACKATLIKVPLNGGGSTSGGTGSGGASTNPSPTPTPTNTARYVYSAFGTTAVSGVTANAVLGSTCLSAPSTTAGISAGFWVASQNGSTDSYTTVVGIPGTCPAGQIQISQAAGVTQADTFSFYYSQLNAFALSSATNTVTPVPGSPFTIPMGANNLAASPDGKFVFVLSDLGSATTLNFLNVFQVTPSTGALTAIPSARVTLSGLSYTNSMRSFQIAGSNYLYFTDFVGNEIYGFRINSTTGALTALNGSPYFVPGPLIAGNPPGDDADGSPDNDGTRYYCTPSDLGITPNGKFLYTACDEGGNVGDEAVAGFSINSSTGELTLLAGSPWLTSFGGGATGIAVSPDGNYVYATDAGNSGWGPQGVDVFSAAANGALTIVNALGTPYATGGTAFWGYIDPSGSYLYTADTNAIGITPLSGDIPQTPDAELPTVDGYGKLAMDPDGLFLAQTGTPGNGATDLLLYSRSSTDGSLTPLTGSPIVNATSGDVTFLKVSY